MFIYTLGDIFGVVFFGVLLLIWLGLTVWVHIVSWWSKRGRNQKST